MAGVSTQMAIVYFKAALRLEFHDVGKIGKTEFWTDCRKSTLWLVKVVKLTTKKKQFQLYLMLHMKKKKKRTLYQPTFCTMNYFYILIRGYFYIPTSCVKKKKNLITSSETKRSTNTSRVNFNETYIQNTLTFLNKTYIQNTLSSSFILFNDI